MRTLVHGISPAWLEALGWTLLDFVWQGAALAALFAVANALLTRATTRYALAVITLVLMMTAPALTFTRLLKQNDPAAPYRARGAWAPAATPVGAFVKPPPGAPAHQTAASQPAEILWFVEAWFLGVLLLSLRTAGGFFLVAHMRRREVEPVARELLEKCLALQKKMGLERLIGYFECLRLDAPAVLGWFRPVVLLPARALTGLGAEQIEMIVAHELAHIRRLDGFVNLFQIGVETLLFYHPAVWWVSQRIRTEREHCCDDQAIAVCGDAVNYARALTLMEQWRTAPALVMAANRGPLARRVVRLLGLDRTARGFRLAGLAVALACLAGALLAGHAFLGVAHAALGGKASSSQAAEQERGHADEQASTSVIVVRPEKASTYTKSFQSTAPQAKDKDKDKEKEQSGGERNTKSSYLDAMEAAGLTNLSADELVGMKVQGVTPEYVKEIHDLGMKPTAEEFIGMRVQGITPEYIREMRAISENLGVDELIGMRVQGVTPQYANDMRGLGLKADADNLIGMKVQGVTPEYVRGIEALGFKPDADELVGMKVQGITPEYVKEIQATGLTPDVDDLVGMKVQGVTADYARALEALGLKPNTEELIGMKVQGVTPEYVKSLEDAGFKHVESFEIIGAKIQGITPEFIEKARQHGFRNLTLDKLITLKQAEVF